MLLTGEVQGSHRSLAGAGKLSALRADLSRLRSLDHLAHLLRDGRRGSPHIQEAEPFAVHPEPSTVQSVSIGESRLEFSAKGAKGIAALVQSMKYADRFVPLDG